MKEVAFNPLESRAWRSLNLYDCRRTIMESTNLETGLTVEETLARWPQTAVVFNHYKSACVGCALSPFCTLEDVARTYRFDLDQLLAELQASIQQDTGIQQDTSIQPESPDCCESANGLLVVTGGN
jgi:hybrid cluster-associated redox disulfide protein